MQAWLADKLEHWPIERLLPYIRNARTHSEEQIAQIAASIAEFGFTAPILAGSDGVIVAGHGRLAAARKLGLATVPVVVLEHLTPTQRRALVIADNKIAENAGWDEELLRLELADLQEANFDLALTGFDVDELLEIMAGEETTTEGHTDEDAAPEVPVIPVSKAGDVWICGQHRLLCGDSTEATSYDTLLGNDRVIRQGRALSGSEDFAFFLEEVPGSYLLIGNGDSESDGHGACMVHNPGYDFHDGNIAIGSAFWSLLVKRYLQN